MVSTRTPNSGSRALDDGIGNAGTDRVSSARCPALRWHNCAMASGAAFRCDQHGELSEPAESLGQLLLVEYVHHPVDREFANGHTVHREGAGLVHADHRRRPEGLDHGRPTREHVPLGHPPGAEGEEHRQYDGELLRQHRHGDGGARERAFEPVASCQPVDQDHHCGSSDPDDGDHSDQAVDLPLTQDC